MKVFFFLENIKKSYNLLLIANKFSVNKNSKIIFLYNNTAKDYQLYLNDLIKAFPFFNFIYYEKYVEEKNDFQSDLFFMHELYSQDAISYINNFKSNSKNIVLSYNVGLDEIDKNLARIQYDKVLTFNKPFILYLIKNRKCNFYKTDEIINLGDISQFKNIIEHERIDYLIFLPTKMVYENNSDKFNFLMDFDNYLNKINEFIYFKIHPGLKESYFHSNSIYFNILKPFVTFVPTLFLTSAFKIFSFNTNISKLIIALYYKKIIKNQKLKLLDYPFLPIELYLNQIKIELAGSYSNTLISSSFLDLKIVLFGRKSIPDKSFKRNQVFDSRKYLKLNMNYFYNIKENNYILKSEKQTSSFFID